MATPRPVVGRKPLWIGLAVLVALAVVLPVLGMLLSGSDARDALRYLPADCQAVASINVPEIRNSDLMKRIVAKLPEGRNWEDQLLRETGIAAGDVARITVGIGDFGGEQPIIVVSLSRAVDPRQLLQRPGQPTWSEEKIGDTVLYTQARAGTYFPNERTIVGGDVAALRRALSSPRENRPSGRLAAVVDSLDFSRTLTIVGVVPEGPLPLSDEIPVQPELLRRVSGFSVYADLRKDLEVAATLICQDSESAEQIRKIVDGLLTMFTQAPDLPEERRKLIESIQVSSSGATIQAKLTIGQDVLEKLADSVPTIPARGTDLPAEPSDGTVR